jgi:hypothetical protein
MWTSDIGLPIFYGRSFPDGLQFALEVEGAREMKQGHVTLKELARLLERAAKKHNESADATCCVAACFDLSDGDLSDEMFDSVFETVTELAGISLERKPDYGRAARKLGAEAHRRTKHA